MSVRKRKLRGGVRWAYDKTIRGVRLWSPYIYLTREQAEAAETQAAHHFRTTGQVFDPTAITGDSSSEKPETVAEVFRRWTVWLHKHRSRRHAMDMESLFARACEVAPEYASMPAKDLREHHIEDWGERWVVKLAEDGKGPGEVNKFFLRAGTAFNGPWGRRRARREFPDNPFQYVDRFAVERRAKYVPSPAEVNKVLMVSDGEFRLFLEILVGTGARVAEAREMAWEQVSCDEAPYSVVLYSRKTADGSRVPRRLPISDDLASRFRDWRHQQGPGKLYVFQQPDKSAPRVKTWERKRHKIACMQAGVKYYPVSSYRHYRASKWAQEGVPLTTIQARLGHAKATTTDRYLRELVGV